MTTALITGISGMVGSHLADYLIEHTDWKIVGLIRWRSPLDNISHIIPSANVDGRIKFAYGDLRDTLSIEKVVEEAKPDYVFHLAAQSFPKTSFDAPLDTLETNVQGTVRVLDSVHRYNPKAVVHVCSSSEVFGRVPASKLPIDEECTFHPASPYAISKVAKQIALAEAGFIKPLIQVGNLKSLRTIADVRDAVRAYYMLTTINPTKGEYYNIGGQHTAEVGEILDHLISLSSISGDLKIVQDPTRMRPIDADLQVPNTSKFTKHTGWTPEISFEKTMLDLLEYWREKVKHEGNRFLQR